MGLYDPATGVFHLKYSHTGGVADKAFRYGPANLGWLTVSADWDGDDTLGLYAPESGNFYLKNTLSGGIANVTFRFGSAGLDWLPLGGDWQ